MYKVVITHKLQTQPQVMSFSRAVDMRNYINEHEAKNPGAVFELFEVTPLKRIILNERAQLEEECEELGIE